MPPLLEIEHIVGYHPLSLGNPVLCNRPLGRAFEPVNRQVPFCGMFGVAMFYPPAPYDVTPEPQLAFHQLPDPSLSQAKLQADGFKGCPVFPGHLDDAVDLCFGKRAVFHWGKIRVLQTILFNVL